MASVKPPMPVGCAKVNAQGVLTPCTWENVFHFFPGTWDPANLNDVVQLVKSAVYDLYHVAFSPAGFPASWRIKTFKVAFRDAEDSLYRATVADAFGGTGGATQDAQVAYLINWTTNDDRRGGKPRSYIAGVDDGDMANSAELTNDALVIRSAAIQSWIDGLGARSHGTASGLVFSEISYRNGKTWRDTAKSWPIRAGSLSPYVATQRRRIDRLRT